MSLKSALRPFLPRWLVRAHQRIVSRRIEARMAKLGTRDIFSEVYRDGLWSNPGMRTPSSGAGSHDSRIVDPYVAAVTAFLQKFPSPPNVVDLGCGDFAVGGRLRASCAAYTAVDIVPELVERLSAAHADLDVTFLCLDLENDPLPEADVAFLRQVLQHLANDQIARIKAKLDQYQYVIVTEHLPAGQFQANRDKATGPGIRLYQNSGVVLHAPPFDLQALEQRVLCEARTEGEVIQTTLYRMR